MVAHVGNELIGDGQGADVVAALEPWRYPSQPNLWGTFSTCLAR